MRNFFKITILSFFPIFFMFISCNNKTSQRLAEKLKSDSIFDSIQNVHTDSLARIAWGDAYFGISIDDARKTKVFKKASFYNNSFNELYGSAHLALADAELRQMFVVHALFFNNRLYEIELKTLTRNANYYDTYIRDAVDYLKDLIQEKYDIPTEYNGFPSFLQMQPGRERIAYGWKIGVKYIVITVKEVQEGSEYLVYCHITNSKESKPVDDYNKKLSDEREAKKVNSF